MKTVKLNAFNNPFVYGIDNKEYLVFNIDNETQTLKFQSLIGDLKVKTANILFKSNSLPAKLYEMVVDDDILTFTLPSVLTGYNGSMYVYLFLNYSDDLSTSDLYTFKLVDKGSSTFNFEISSICESNISTIVSEEIKNEGIAKSILDTVSNYEFDKLQHAQQSLSLVEHAFSSTLEKRIDLFNSAYDKANETKSNTTGDINDSDIDIPDSNTDSDLKDYVENVKKQMAERLKDVTAVSEQIQDEMTQEKQSFLGSSLIFQQDLKQERDIISAYGESTRQHMDQEFNEVKDHADKVFADFSKEIPDLDASIKQVNDKIVATDNKVGTLNTKVTNVENDITELEKMHNEVTQTINNGKLISLYSNSLDFGDYDYSGNPNLMCAIKASDFRRDGDSDVLISDVAYNSIRFTTQNVNNIKAYTQSNISSLVSGKTYTISAKVKIEEGTTGNIDQIKVSYRKTAGGTILLSATATGIEVGKEITIKGTGVVNYAINDLSRFYLSIWVGDDINGSVIVSDVKIEEGSTATPYQPNLLDEPYCLSKVPLGENIADPTKTFPIKTRADLVYSGTNTEPYIAGQQYTITMKATKPATQTFNVYLNFGTIGVGSMTPVEGLTDVWQKTFTVSQAHIDAGVTARLAIYQTSNSPVGDVQIDWLKIEKGDTRTPNISQFKYFGEGLKDSNNPYDYSWDITPEYVEKSLNDTISLTDSKVAELGSVKADKTALSQTNILLANGLNSKVDKGGGGQITLPMLNTDVKTAMAGGSVAVVGKDAVLAENIVKDTISPDEVGFVSRAILSNTLVDDTKIQRGGYYDYTNGAWTAREDYNSTGLIPCVPGQSYTRVLWHGQITYYDKNGSFVVGDSPYQMRTFKVPDNSNISYMRLAFSNSEPNFTVNSGTELLEKDSYKEEFSIDLNLDIDNKIENLKIDVSEIKDNVDKLMPVIVSNNLVDKSIIKFGGYYDFTNGTWKDRADINSTGFISCKPQDTFVASASGKYIGGNVTFWNKEGEYVSGIDVSNANGAKTSFTVPENDDITTFKMSFTAVLTQSYIINKGIDILPYDEYKLEYVYNENISSPNIQLIEENLQEIKTKLELTLQSFNSIGDISTMQYRIENYKTTFWLTKINRYTFNGGKIKPKVRLTSSSVDSGDPKSVLDYITNHDVMCCINAGVFDVTSGIVDGRLIIDGAIQKDSAPVIHKNQWTLGIKSNGSLSAYDSTISASAMLKDGCESAVTGFVPIIMDGSMVDKSLFLTFEHLTQPNPRQVICQTASGDYFVFSCDGRKDGEKGLTLEQIGEILLLFGVTFAYNLDGGGSTQTFVKKKRINRLLENRPIPSIIVFE